MLNFVLLGWLLGTQNARAPMWMVIITNLTNIVLDLLLVLGLGLKVEGAAIASVIADYAGLLFGLLCVGRYWRQHQLPAPFSFIPSLTKELSRLVRSIVTSSYAHSVCKPYLAL